MFLHIDWIIDKTKSLMLAKFFRFIDASNETNIKSSKLVRKVLVKDQPLNKIHRIRCGSMIYCPY